MSRSSAFVDVSILVVAAVLVLTGLGSNTVQNEDEARYALSAQEMLASGEWIEPTIQGAPWWNKAPLRVWTNAALGSVFGFDLWAIRLPSALAGLGVVVLVLVLGRAWGGVAVGRWAAVILTSSTYFLYVHGVRTGEMEAFVLLLWLATMVFATKVPDDERWALAAAATLGLVGMAKHAAYVVPVGGVLLLFWWRAGILTTLRARTWILGAAIVLAIVVPWHAIMAWRHPDFLAVYFGEQVAGRVEEQVAGPTSRLFALRVLKDALFPWSLWIPFLVFAWRRAETAWRGVDTTLAVWILGMLAATAVSKLDLPWYLMPALPAAALWIARGLATLEVSWAIGAGATALLLLSPSNVLEFDVIHTRAMWGGIGVQILGLVRGASWWWPQVAVAALALVILVAPRNVPSARRMHWALLVWAVFAMAHAAMPLRDAFAPSTMGRLVEDVRRSRHDAVIVHAPEFPPSDLLAFALQREGVEFVVRTTGSDDLDALRATHWILGYYQDVQQIQEPTPSQVWAEFAAIPPDLTPENTVPREAGPD